MVQTTFMCKNGGTIDIFYYSAVQVVFIKRFQQNPAQSFILHIFLLSEK